MVMKKGALALLMVAGILFVGFGYLCFLIWRHAQMVGEVETELDKRDVHLNINRDEQNTGQNTTETRSAS